MEPFAHAPRDAAIGCTSGRATIASSSLVPSNPLLPVTSTRTPPSQPLSTTPAPAAGDNYRPPVAPATRVVSTRRGMLPGSGPADCSARRDRGPWMLHDEDPAPLRPRRPLALGGRDDRRARRVRAPAHRPARARSGGGLRRARLPPPGAGAGGRARHAAHLLLPARVRRAGCLPTGGGAAA